MSDNLTPFSSQCEILADLWLNYRTDETFSDFFHYNDLGLPLAYAITNQIVEAGQTAENLVSETFALLIEGLGIDDTGFENLDDLLDMGEE